MINAKAKSQYEMNVEYMTQKCVPAHRLFEQTN